MEISIVNLTMTGSAYEYDIPADASSITIQPITGNLTVRERGGSDGFTVFKNTAMVIDTRGIRNKQLDFVGTASDVVQLFILTGVLG